MVGSSPTTWAGHPRLFFVFTVKDVDGLDKPGHDDKSCCLVEGVMPLVITL
jgi:hypothetical protein